MSVIIIIYYYYYDDDDIIFDRNVAGSSVVQSDSVGFV